LIDMLRRNARRGVAILIEDAPELGQAPEAGAAIA
jgi:hypothetical protein